MSYYKSHLGMPYFLVTKNSIKVAYQWDFLLFICILFLVFHSLNNKSCYVSFEQLFFYTVIKETNNQHSFVSGSKMIMFGL